MSLLGIAGSVGSIVSGFSGLGAGNRIRKAQDRQYKYTTKLMDKQYEMNQREKAEDWNKYNSPAAQRAAMRAAGINPFVEGSVVTPQGVSSAGVDQGSAPDMAVPDYSGVGSAIQQGASSLFTMQETAKNNAAQRDLWNSEAELNRSRKTGQDNENSMFDTISAMKQDEALIKKIEAKMKLTDLETYKQKSAAELQKLQQEVAKLLADTSLTDEQRNNLKIVNDNLQKEFDAKFAVMDSQVTANNAAAGESNASAALKWSQKDTEDALRQGRSDELVAHKSEINQHIELMKAQARTEEERKELTIQQMRLQRALADYENNPSVRAAKHLRTVANGLWSVFNPLDGLIK